MASSMIHIVVANEVNKTINRDKNKLFIGTISPDISKLIGESKNKSHFLSNTNGNIPNIDVFLNKYKKFLYDDFVLGYYIHLYTDYLWFKYFIEDVDYCSLITKVDGGKFLCDKDTFIKYVYNDYTNLNIELIDRYDLDLEIFYNEIPSVESIIDEIPMDRLDVIVGKAGNIISNSKMNKTFLFDVDNIDKFISFATKIILSELENLNVF